MLEPRMQREYLIVHGLITRLITKILDLILLPKHKWMQQRQSWALKNQDPSGLGHICWLSVPVGFRELFRPSPKVVILFLTIFSIIIWILCGQRPFFIFLQSLYPQCLRSQIFQYMFVDYNYSHKRMEQCFLNYVLTACRRGEAMLSETAPNRSLPQIHIRK